MNNTLLHCSFHPVVYRLMEEIYSHIFTVYGNLSQYILTYSPKPRSPPWATLLPHLIPLPFSQQVWSIYLLNSSQIHLFVSVSLSSVPLTVINCHLLPWTTYQSHNWSPPFTFTLFSWFDNWPLQSTFSSFDLLVEWHSKKCRTDHVTGLKSFSGLFKSWWEGGSRKHKFSNLEEGK